MSNPTIVSVTPNPNSTDIVLGSSIVVIFSKAIDTDSFNNSTFALTGPNFSSIVGPHQLVEQNPMPAQGKGYILGTFGFSTNTYSNWASFTVYTVGEQVVDSNGDVQTVTQAGTSSPYAPAWLTTTGAATIDNNVPGWEASAHYTFGQYILDPNSNLQKCTISIGGTSGLAAPSWNKTINGITFDGSITWTNYGTFNAIVWLNGGAANSGGTVATFTPSKPLAPGIIYSVLIVGADTTFASTFVQDLSGNPLLNSFQWSFTAGTLNINTPPIQNPIVTQSYIDPNTIIVIPRPPVGVDDPSVSNISVVELIFPAPINPNSFDPTQLLIGVEPIMNDPDVMVPYGATASYIIQGNKLICTITNVS